MIRTNRLVGFNMQLCVSLDQLNPFSPMSVRTEALTTLLSTAQLNEVVGSQTWSSIKTGLQAALLDITGDKASQDEGTKLSILALKVYTRLVGSTTENNGPFATREGFVGLTDFLIALYTGKYPNGISKSMYLAFMKY